jgi:ribosomal protein S18 acetylase RimI-like enzyme
MGNELTAQQRGEAQAATLREVSTQDEEFLFELYRSTRAEEMAAWGWDAAQQTAFLKLQFNGQRVAFEVQYEGADHYIILLDERRVGRLLVNRTEEEIRLVDISLLPEYRNGGTGSALIRELLSEAAARGKPLRLHVLKTNRAARLYERLGFQLTADMGTHLQMVARPGA